MCIRVEYAPRHLIREPYDATQLVITIPAELGATLLFTLQAVRAVLTELGIKQDHFGARCWCGEDIDFTAHTSQQRKNEVILGA